MKLRGALIGAGNIALRSHAPQWAQDERLRDAIEIVAVADLANPNLEAIRSILPHARRYADGEELLQREGLDFCDICTPPDTHWPLIEEAARRGLHIVCEKPLAPTVADAERIARIVRGAGVVFQPCHQYHFSPQWMAVRGLLPRLGRLHFAEYQVLRTMANEGNPNWSPAWRTDQSIAGGGILVDHGAHILYQLHAVLGEPKTVNATVGRLLHHQYQVEDTALVTLDYGDRLAHVSLTWAARHRAIHFRFVGEKGELSGDDRSIRVRAADTEEIRFDDDMSKNSWHSEWYAPLLHEFLAQVRGHDVNTRALDEAVHVTRVIERAYESAHLGRSLPLSGGPSDGAPTAAAGAEAPRGSIAPAEVWAPREGPAVVAAPPPAARVPEAAASDRSGSAARRRLITASVRGAAWLAVLGFGVWAVRNLEWRTLWLAVRGADLRWLALAAAINLGVIGLWAVRWLALLRPLGARSRLRDAFEAMMVGLAVSSLVPARAGELARMRWMHRRTGLSQASILGSMGLDQVLNAAGLVACLAVLPLFGSVAPWMRPAALSALALFALGIVALLLLRPGRAAAHDPARAARSSILDRLRHGLKAGWSPRALGVSLVASLVSWAVEVIVIRFSLRAVGISLPLAASLVVIVAVNLMLVFPVAPPGNLGTLEVGATLGLLSYGVGKERALAFAICYHMLQLLPIVLLGLWYLGTERLVHRRAGGGLGAVVDIGAGVRDSA